jgi:hypothetical protein
MRKVVRVAIVTFLAAFGVACERTPRAAIPDDKVGGPLIRQPRRALGVGGLTLIEEQVVTVPEINNPTSHVWVNGQLLAHGHLGMPRFDAPAMDLGMNTIKLWPVDDRHSGAQQMSYSPLTGRLYVLFYSKIATPVSEVNPATLEVRDLVYDETAPAMSGGICALGDSVYVVTQTNPSTLLRYRLTDGARTGSLTLVDFNGGHTVDTDGTSLYATAGYGGGAAGWIVKIDPGTMTVRGSLRLAAMEGATDTMAVHAGSLWLGTVGGWIVRVADDMSSATRIQTGFGNPVFGVAEAMGYVWASYGSHPGAIARVDPATNAVATTEFPLDGHDYPDLVLTDGSKLYVDFYMIPMRTGRYTMASAQPVPVTQAATPIPATATPTRIATATPTRPPTLTATKTPTRMPTQTPTRVPTKCRPRWKCR